MPNVANFLMERMKSAGIDVIFGVPGDYILGMYKKIEDAKEIELVGTTDESNAGFAADAYARVHGVGCCCVTYNVGALKLVNSIAGAFAERSPVVVLVGSPGIRERTEGALLHHTVRDFDTQRDIFSNITCANTILNDPQKAGYNIDRVFEALKHHSQPIYIELPRDIADQPVGYDINQGTPKSPISDSINLREAVDEVVAWINKAMNPVILAGVEIARFGIGVELVKWAERMNIPMFTELLSKSVVAEDHPLFGGVYSGCAAKPELRDAVEQSDCIVMLGVLLTDMVLGSAKPNFSLRQTVRANMNGLKVSNHHYENVIFKDFCTELFRATTKKKPAPAVYKKAVSAFEPSNCKLTTKRFFEKIDSTLSKNMVVITDVGDSLFGAMDLTIKNANTFISPAYYTSMGMAIPAALGVCLAKPQSRPIVLVGDGAFQMSFGEISTLVRRGLNPIIFVLNNGGYTTERFILDGAFNDIAGWDYHCVNHVFKGGLGFLVTTEQELESAVDQALASKEVSVINVIVGSKDITPALSRVTAGFASIVK